MEFIPWTLFAFSVVAHSFTIHRYLRLKEQAAQMVRLYEETQAKIKEPKLDITAQDLLHDLTRRGGAVLKVEVIDPTNLLLRSPRL